MGDDKDRELTAVSRRAVWPHLAQGIHKLFSDTVSFDCTKHFQKAGEAMGQARMTRL